MTRRLALLLALAPALGRARPGAVTGFVSDRGCAKRPSSACAKKCIDAGSEAVLVDRGGRIWSVDDRAAIVPFAGQVVSVSGELRGRRFVRVNDVVRIGAPLGPQK